jgi:putative ABC transport system permease protein
MLSATLKSMLARKLRLLLSGLAVVIGVMSVSGALILTRTLGNAFDVLFETVNQDLDVQVTGLQHVEQSQGGGDAVTEPIPGGVVDEVAAVPGVAAAFGVVIEDGARVVGADGKVIASSGPPRFGVGWRGEVGFVELRAGRGPTQPDEVAISAGLADNGGFSVGDRVGVLTLEPERTFTVVGIFGYTGDRDSLGGETRVAFIEPVAQELMLGQEGSFSAVNVRAQEGISRSQLRDVIQDTLGDRYIFRTREQVAEDQSSDVTQFLGFLQSFLMAFAIITLLVGAFLIFNTFSILVAQRTRELGLLRSLGGSRRQVIRSVLLEAIVIGLTASTLGFLAGFGIALLLRSAIESVSGVTFPEAGLTVPTSAIVGSYVVGVLVTMAAALRPALRASRIPPIAALRDAAAIDTPTNAFTLASAVPVVVGSGLIGLALFGDLGDATPMALLGGVLLTFIGVATLMPAISRPTVLMLGRPLAWSITGMLGQRNSARNPRRTASTAAALMIGIALVTGVSVLASSIRASLGDLVSDSLGAELIISGDDVTNRSSAEFDPRVIDRIEQVPGVREAVAVYTDTAQMGDDPIEVAAADLPAMADIFELSTTEGDLPTLSGGEVAIDDVFAEDHHLGVRSTLDLVTQRGAAETFTIVGIFEQSRLVPGSVVLSVEDARAGFRTSQARFGYIKLDAGAALASIQLEVAALLQGNPEVSVRDQSGFLAQLTSQIDTAAVMLYVLLALALIIALLGIINTLALSVVERTRELGLLRAVGMRRAQVVQMVTVESLVIAVFGALLGVVVGTGLGTAAARALADEFIPVLSLPWQTMVVFLAVAALAGLLSAIIPAVRASRIDVLKAIAYE